MAQLGKNRGLTALALLGVLALLMAVTVGPAASASGGGAAEVAKKKKKCKKGFKKVKKKNGKIKCVKKKQQSAPLVRATIKWTNADAADADLDLFVFDASGGVAGKGASTIPNSTISADVVGINGSETFTDNASKPLRVFSFAVCYQVGGSAHAPFTIEYTTADGVKHTEDRDPGSSFHYDFPGGAPIPAGYCPD